MHDPVPPEEPDGLDVTLVRTVHSSPRRELRVSIVTSDRGTSIRLQTFTRDAFGWKPTGRFHVFTNEIDGAIEAMAEARDALPPGSIPSRPRRD